MIHFVTDLRLEASFQPKLTGLLKQKMFSLVTMLSRHVSRNKIREVLSRRGSGRIYRSKTGSGTHQASAPGEPPSPDTYRYLNSWETQVVTKPDGSVEAQVGSTLWNVFGRRLELGGKDKRGIYIAPRPHVRVVYEDAQVEIDKDLARLRESGL